jgi:hypothetical protein
MFGLNSMTYTTFDETRKISFDLNIINEELYKWPNSDIPLWQAMYIVNLHKKEEKKTLRCICYGVYVEYSI